jgi:flagellar biogenesis protein FliO
MQESNQQGSSKFVSKLVAIIFILMLILPVCYILARNLLSRDNGVKNNVPQTEQMGK